jgi:predicted ester cyclase
MQTWEEESAETDENVRANPSSRKSTDYLEQAGLKTNEAFPDHTALFHFLDVFNNWPRQQTRLAFLPSNKLIYWQKDASSTIS